MIQIPNRVGIVNRQAVVQHDTARGHLVLMGGVSGDVWCILVCKNEKPPIL